MILTGLGGGTPGGSTTQLQFHNAGVFGGFGSWDGTTLSVFGAGVANQLTLTGSATGDPVLITPTGSDADIAVKIRGKGPSGFVQLGPDTYGSAGWAGYNIGTEFVQFAGTEASQYGHYIEMYTGDIDGANVGAIGASIEAGDITSTQDQAVIDGVVLEASSKLPVGRTLTAGNGGNFQFSNLGGGHVVSGRAFYMQTTLDATFGGGGGSVGNMYGAELYIYQETGTITNQYGFGVKNNHTGGTTTNLYLFYASDFAGVATNPYYLWFDSRGVYRIREDNVADGAGNPQAIPALYNPRFAKYVGGAPDFERGVQQFVGNVFQMGTEAGGTGVLRPVKIIGASLDVPATFMTGTLSWSALDAGTTLWSTTTPGAIANGRSPFEMVTLGNTGGGSTWNPGLYWGYNASGADATEPIMRQVIEGAYEGDGANNFEMYWEYFSTDRLTGTRPIFYVKTRDASTTESLNLTADQINIVTVSAASSTALANFRHSTNTIALTVRRDGGFSNISVNRAPSATIAAYIENGTNGQPATSGTYDGVLVNTLVNNASNSTAVVSSLGALTTVSPTGTSTQAGAIYGVSSQVTTSGSGTGLLSDLRGGNFLTQSASSHPVSEITGIYDRFGRSSSGTATAIYGMQLVPFHSGSATVGEIYAMFIHAIGNSGTVTNDYGIYIANRNRGSSQNYAIYSNLGLVRFGDSVSIAEQVGRSALTLTGATQTASFPVIDASQIWNAIGTTFTLFKGNATSTNSAAASMLMDLQTGGVSQFQVRKDGTIKLARNQFLITGDGSQLYFDSTALPGVVPLSIRSYVEVALGSTTTLEWANGTNAAGGTIDLLLGREAAAVLQMGSDVNGAAVAQTFKAHDGITGSNIAGANLTLAGGRGTGTGAPGNLRFQTAVQVASGTTAQTLGTRFEIIENKIGFFGATPVVQGASIADATGGAIIDAEARTAINALISRIEATGLIATV